MFFFSQSLLHEVVRRYFVQLLFIHLPNFRVGFSTDATLQRSSNARSGSSAWTGPQLTRPAWRTCSRWPTTRGVWEATLMTRTSTFISAAQVSAAMDTELSFPKWDLLFCGNVVILKEIIFPSYSVCMHRWSRPSENGNGGQADGLRHTERLESVRPKLQFQVGHRHLHMDIRSLYNAVTIKSYEGNGEWPFFNRDGLGSGSI